MGASLLRIALAIVLVGKIRQPFFLFLIAFVFVLSFSLPTVVDSFVLGVGRRDLFHRLLLGEIDFLSWEGFRYVVSLLCTLLVWS